MGDFYTGYCDAGYVRVSEAVAASLRMRMARVPPLDSPVRRAGGRQGSRRSPSGRPRSSCARRSDDTEAIWDEALAVPELGRTVMRLCAAATFAGPEALEPPRAG
jgi:hypothetical protein